MYKYRGFFIIINWKLAPVYVVCVLLRRLPLCAVRFMNQLAQLHVLLNCIFSTLSYFLCSQTSQSPIFTCVNLVAVSTCRSRMLSYCIKRKVVPLEVQILFGIQELSWGHVRIICKVMKSKLWHKVRLYHDCIKIFVARDGNRGSLREFQRLATQTTEFLWKRTGIGLPQRRRAATSTSSVTFLGGASVLSDVHQVLEKVQSSATSPPQVGHHL